MNLPGQWFSEIFAAGGSAFSVKCVRKLHSERSLFQEISIYQTEKFGNLMVIDGYIMLSSFDHYFYHEMLCHPALFRHPNPRRVVIVGGGDCGSASEILKHANVEQLSLVEIDQQVTHLAEQYFPELCQSNQDPRLQFCFADGIEWMAQAQEASRDVVIVDCTDPIGPAQGLFQVSFYRQCLRVLGAQGILVQQSESPLFHLEWLANMHRQMRAAGAVHIETIYFPQCVYPGGWWCATLASLSPLDRFRRVDVASRAFSTRYYCNAIHEASRATPPFVRAALARAL